MVDSNREKAATRVESSLSFSLIAQAMSALSEDEKKKLSFCKYPQICELEARHGVNIGSSYTNDMNAHTFVHYIAEAQ